MTEKHYEWSAGSALPVLARHSQAKHELLREYLIAYVQTLVSSPNQDKLQFSIIDGFCGGGLYKDEATSQEVPGSPLVILEACKEAAFRVNRAQERRKAIELDIKYFFVDADPGAVQHLEWVLGQRGYLHNRVDSDIQVLHGQFDSLAQQLVAAAKHQSKRAGKAIFVLDQYGYAAVPLALLRTILTELPKAEVILTFNVDAFINYATEQQRDRVVAQLGIRDPFRGRSLEDIKRNERDWRRYIQSNFYHGLRTGSGALHFTPFFIRARGGHGDYWLVHLSQHPKARDVMTQTHWNGQNYIHYGGSGLDMFMVGYDPHFDAEAKGQSTLGFEFDDVARRASMGALRKQIPVYLEKHLDGVTFGRFFAEQCNETPATRAMIATVLAELHTEKDILIRTKNGGARRSAALEESDVLAVSKQRKLFLPN